MEKNLLLNKFWTDMFESVYEHIKHDCDPKDYDNGWGYRGLIVADDETGELLASVKEALKYEELVAAEKVNEIIVDEHWPLNSFDKCWQKLLAEARRINHGLLVTLESLSIAGVSSSWQNRKLGIWNSMNTCF